MEDVEGVFFAAVYSLKSSFTSLLFVLIILLVVSVLFVPIDRILSFGLFASPTIRGSDYCPLQLQTKRTKRATGRRYHPKDRKKQKAQKKRAAKMASILDSGFEDIPVPALLPKRVSVVQQKTGKLEPVKTEDKSKSVKTEEKPKAIRFESVKPEPVQLESQPNDQPEDKSKTDELKPETKEMSIEPKVQAQAQAQAKNAAQAHVEDESRGWSPYRKPKSSGRSLLDSNLDYIPFPALEPFENTPVQSDAVDKTEPEQRVEPWDGQIRWAIKGSSVFDNQDEEMNVVRLYGNIFQGPPLSDRWLFQYGLRYIPKERDTNVYRTVRIEGLPETTSLNEVLAVIPGTIYSAELFDTMAITGYKTVIVVFVQERHARYLVSIAQDGLRTASALAQVALVNTPTYPMSPEMEKWVAKGRTRSLILSNVRASTKKDLTRLLNDSEVASCVEYIKNGPLYNHLTVNFYNVESAMKACALLEGQQNQPHLEKCRLGFLKEVESELIVELIAELA